MTNIADLIAAIANGKGAKFASFKYLAKESKELARHTLILGFNEVTLYEKDVAALQEMLPTATGLHLEAVKELLESRETSLKMGIGENPFYTCAGVYVFPEGLNGIKVHVVDGTLHLLGLQESKVVIEPGTYKKVNSAPLTIVKNEIRRAIPSGRIRQFRLDAVQVAKMMGETLILE